MAPKLSDLLVNEGLITPEQIEDALKSQVIFGGKLGTNLVEMNMVKEADVIRCLSKQLERPYISPEQLMAVKPDIIALISKEIAEEFKIIPVSLERRRLTVAMMNPSDLAAIDKISFITGFSVVPVISSELWILHALEHYYEIKRKLRFIRLSGETRGGSREAVTPDPAPQNWIEGNDATASVVKPQAQGAYRDLEFELNSALLPAQSGNDPGLPNRLLDEAEILDLEEQAEPSPLSQEEVVAVLTEDCGRNEIDAAVADYFYQNAERVALFMVKGRIVAGRKAHIRKNVAKGFENFQLTLDEPSVLKLVADTRSFYHGPILDTAGNQKLLAALGGGAPESALLIPITMMGRVVMIYYLDGGNELTKDLEILQNTADMAGLASEILHPLLSQ